MSLKETQEALFDTPSDSAATTSSKKSIGQSNEIIPFRISSARTKKRGAAAFNAESESIADVMKYMILKSEQDSEREAARHRERLELEERREKRFEQMMQVMMEGVFSSKKKKKIDEIDEDGEE